jgi:hypothetical protein
MGCKLLYINAFASEVGAMNDKRASGKLSAGPAIRQDNFSEHPLQRKLAEEVGYPLKL